MITASSFTRDRVLQADGRFWVTEHYTYDDGRTEEYSYLCEAKGEPQVTFDQRGKELALVMSPLVDPIMLKLDAVRNAYLGGDVAQAKLVLGEASGLLEAKAKAV